MRFLYSNVNITIDEKDRAIKQSMIIIHSYRYMYRIIIVYPSASVQTKSKHFARGVVTIQQVRLIRRNGRIYPKRGIFAQMSPKI